jgi:DNA-directed RNA polymerase subunit RPC12/RpoP
MTRPVPPPDEQVEEIEREEEGPLPDSARVRFPCSNCGADTTWDPAADALLCAHCGQARPVPRAEGTILERPLSEAGEAARGLGLAVRVARCGTCGARVTFDDAGTSRLCVYCGSPSVLEQEANRNALRPESLVPLLVGQEKVEESFRRWVRGLWFRPNDLRRARTSQASGVYVPFWTFDARVHSDWSADAGHYYYVTQTYTTIVNRRPVIQTRQVRKVRWVPAWGQRHDDFDDLLVLASAGQPAKLVQELGTFDTTGLVPYRPEYLAGWHAEEYQVDLEQAWLEGQARIEERQRDRCAGDVPGDTQRNLRVKNTISDVRWKHVLLPVWSVAYRYKGKPYAVLVHGQSGRVVGEAPLSWAKILGLVLGLIALALLLVAVASLAGG